MIQDYQQINSLEWLNENMSRNYPLVGTGASSLPTSFLVDIQLVVPYMENVDTSHFFVSRVSRIGDSFQVTIGYMISDPDASVISGFDCAVSTAIPVETLWPYLNQAGNEYVATQLVPVTLEGNGSISGSYRYGIPDEYAAMRNMRGLLYVGTCVDMQDISSTQYTYADTAIIPVRVYMESKPGDLKSVTIVDPKGAASTFTDSLTLVIGEGLTVDVDAAHNTASIAVDELWVDARLEEYTRELADSAIRTINGISPSGGNIQIIGLDCTDISRTDAGVITINNPCAKPCCDQGGADSAAITSALTQLSVAKDLLNNYYMDLSTKVNSMQSRLASLIASRR